MTMTSMRSRINNLIRESCEIVAPKAWSKLYYYHTYRKKCDLENPKTFSEKLIWLKYHDYQNNPLVLSLCDKYEVREYLIKCGLKEILNPLYFVESDIRNISYDRLPDSFVMKISLGCGSNLICPDKNTLTPAALRKYLNSWSKGQLLYDIDSARIGGIKRDQLKKRIICERFLKDDTHDVPPDYKVYCFNGKPETILYISDRYITGEKKACFFDLNWNYIGNSNERYKTLDSLPEKPTCLSEMIEAAKMLSEPFPFVRVDFYVVNQELIFGEMTFFPNDCIGMSEIDINGVSMGDLLDVKTNKGR